MNNICVGKLQEYFSRRARFQLIQWVWGGLGAGLRKGEVLIMGNGVPDNYDWGGREESQLTLHLSSCELWIYTEDEREAPFLQRCMSTDNLVKISCISTTSQALWGTKVNKV